jgi:hypothetical protein
LLFEEDYGAAGWSAPRVDFTTARTGTTGHGRIEVRELTASSMLEAYVDWPCLAQAVKVERTRISKLKSEHQVSYAISSLPAKVADAPRLLAISRAHWRIEHGLQYRRDVTLHEDALHVRVGHAPHVWAALNNLVCGLCARATVSNLAHFQRCVARPLDRWLDVMQVSHQHASSRPSAGLLPHRS